MKKTRSDRPSEAQYAVISSLSPPPPIKTMRKSCPLSRSAPSASRMMRMPLYHIMRPTNRNSGSSAGRSYAAPICAICASLTRPRGKSTPLGMTDHSPR